MPADNYLPPDEQPGHPQRPPERGRADGPDDPSAQSATQRAGRLFDDARDSAQSQFKETKNSAADELHNVAGALRDAARRSSGGDDPLHGLTGSAADGLDRLSSALRNKELGTMLRDVEHFAHAQPVAFFGMALATGFLAVRFMKASQSEPIKESQR